MDLEAPRRAAAVSLPAPVPKPVPTGSSCFFFEPPKREPKNELSFSFSFSLDPFFPFSPPHPKKPAFLPLSFPPRSCDEGGEGVGMGWCMSGDRCGASTEVTEGASGDGVREGYRGSVVGARCCTGWGWYKGGVGGTGTLCGCIGEGCCGPNSMIEGGEGDLWSGGGWDTNTGTISAGSSRAYAS